MKSRNVVEKEKCPFKYKYGVLDGEKGKVYYNGVIIKDVLANYGLNYNAQDIMNSINNIMPINCFNTSRENKINMTLLVKRLLRFKDYFLSNKVTATTEFYSPQAVSIVHNIKVDYSFALKDNDNVFIYKVVNKKNTKLKSGGRTNFTKISCNMELYLLQLAGEKMFPNTHVTAGIVFLTHPKDKKEDLVDVSEFNSKINETIVVHHFHTAQRASMNERIEDIIHDNIKVCEQKCSECVYNNICNYVDNSINLKPIPIKPKTNGKVTFTKHQEKVIDTEKGVYRVLAGAGSGKTTCIANRIVKLIQKGYHLNDILLITFTTKGVEEMKQKIEYWLNVNNISYNKDDFNIFTFNSFGDSLIKKEYKSLGFTQSPTLFEKSENLNYIKELLDSHDEISRYDYTNPFLDLRYAKGAVYQAADDFMALKQEDAIYLEDVEGILDVTQDVAQEILSLYMIYKDYMKQNNLIDYNDQVQLMFKILNNPTNVKKYGYSHIICDEFQDSATCSQVK